VALGAVSPELVAAEIRQGHVRPSLGYQVEHGIEEALLLPRRARRLDREFRPPQGAPGPRRAAVSRFVDLLQALARQGEMLARGARGPTGARILRAGR
jgi:hypothetical protein